MMRFWRKSIKNESTIAARSCRNEPSLGHEHLLGASETSSRPDASVRAAFWRALHFDPCAGRALYLGLSAAIFDEARQSDRGRPSSRYCAVGLRPALLRAIWQNARPTAAAG